MLCDVVLFIFGVLKLLGFSVSMLVQIMSQAAINQRGSPHMHILVVLHG